MTQQQKVKKELQQKLQYYTELVNNANEITFNELDNEITFLKRFLIEFSFKLKELKKNKNVPEPMMEKIEELNKINITLDNKLKQMRKKQQYLRSINTNNTNNTKNNEGGWVRTISFGLFTASVTALVMLLKK